MEENTTKIEEVKGTNAVIALAVTGACSVLALVGFGGAFLIKKLSKKKEYIEYIENTTEADAEEA